jgi:ribosomal protein L7Ae-like RNA K-turn-binding protein
MYVKTQNALKNAGANGVLIVPSKKRFRKRFITEWRKYLKENDKIATYIGFAIKSGGCLLGNEQVVRSKKRLFILFLSRDASMNTKKEIVSRAEKHNIPLIIPQNIDLQFLVHKENCKTAAVTHKELAQSILKSIKENENYTLIGGNIDRQ